MTPVIKGGGEPWVWPDGAPVRVDRNYRPTPVPPHAELRNPSWVAPVAFGGLLLVAVAIVVIFAVMW